MLVSGGTFACFFRTFMPKREEAEEKGSARERDICEGHERAQCVACERVWVNL